MVKEAIKCKLLFLHCRVHCHELGHTIVGDFTYSNRRDILPHRYLHITDLLVRYFLGNICVCVCVCVCLCVCVCVCWQNVEEKIFFSGYFIIFLYYPV